MTKPFRYKAFVSYSHVDRHAAARLFNRLESYRLPARIRENAGENADSGRLGVFFRDREELPAAADLGREVRDALAQSEYLVVLCSPAAAASPWVNREIAEFKRLGREKRVLAAIIDGEPFADGKPGAVECFPEALRFMASRDGSLTTAPAEPLAADFRPKGDGDRLGYLKLVAALAGVELARLLDRDQQRRLRRVTAVTLASLAVMIMMGVLTAVAMDARREADRQRGAAVAAQSEAEARRADAEGLIEFMLTDLRDKLEPVGRLDALQVVGEKAQAYYDQQERAAMPNDALARRAKVFHLLGEIDERRGDLASARENWLEASAATEALLARAPDDAQRIFDHAQSVFWVGYSAYKARDYVEAEKGFGDYKKYAEALVEIDPANADWRIELAFAERNLGALFFEQLGYGPDLAIASFSRSLAEFEAASQARPDAVNISLELATAHAWLADAIIIGGSVTQALFHRKAQNDIYNRILDRDPDNNFVKLRQLECIAALVAALRDAGEFTQAFSQLRVAEQLIASISAVETSNTKLYLSAIWIYARLADLALSERDSGRAERLLDMAQVFQGKIHDLSSAPYKLMGERTAYVTILQSELLWERGDVQGAVRLLHPLLNGEGTADTKLSVALLARAEHLTGLMTLESQDEESSAHRRFQNVVSLLAPRREKLGPRARSLLMHAYCVLGERDVAEEIGDRLKMQNYFQQKVEYACPQAN